MCKKSSEARSIQKVIRFTFCELKGEEREEMKEGREFFVPPKGQGKRKLLFFFSFCFLRL
jgi:hypothetical protein